MPPYAQQFFIDQRSGIPGKVDEEPEELQEQSSRVTRNQNENAYAAGESVEEKDSSKDEEQ
eukprot:5804125-Karenia_brevis.AAC.1